MKFCKLQKDYEEVISKDLIQDLSLSNKFEVPKIEKICINSSVSHKDWDAKNFEKIGLELSNIAGQKAKQVKSKMSVSSFNLREGMPIAYVVTLRKKNMYNFLEKLIYIALPRIRDFSFYKASMFDKNYNFNFGIKDVSIFPEFINENFDKPWGMDINIVIKSKSSENSRALLKKYNFPLK